MPPAVPRGSSAQSLRPVSLRAPLLGAAHRLRRARKRCFRALHPEDPEVLVRAPGAPDSPELDVSA